MSIMSEAVNLVALRNNVKSIFDRSKPGVNGLKPDVATIAADYLATKPSAYIDQCLHEFDCMTDNYAVFTKDLAVLGELMDDHDRYNRQRLVFAVKAIIYGQYANVPALDQVRLEAARALEEQDEQAS